MTTKKKSSSIVRTLAVVWLLTCLASVGAFLAGGISIVSGLLGTALFTLPGSELLWLLVGAGVFVVLFFGALFLAAGRATKAGITS